MLSKIIQIITFCLLVFYQNVAYSKSFDQKNLSNYFSALISLENNKSEESLKYFNFSKNLKESHSSYLKNYIFSLVQSKKVKKAISEIKITKNNKFKNFFESHLLLTLDSIKEKDYKKSLQYVEKLKNSSEEGTLQTVISKTLEEYVYLFNFKKIKPDQQNQFRKLGLINLALQNCYLETVETENLFINLINLEDEANSRYLFFYSNYLADQKKYSKIKNLYKKVELINSTLLIAQSKKWVDTQNYDIFNSFFSCKNSSDIISEFLFIISNLYASEDSFEKSNFYLSLSNYLNPNFKFNLALLADNYFKKEQYFKTKEVLKNFDKKNEVYYWYKLKKNSQIIYKKKNTEDAFKYIFNKYNDIKNPSIKTIYEMGNLIKSFEKYELSIEYYTEVLSKIDLQSVVYADILYRRGGSYERIGDNGKADKDLLKSLEINPDEPHVLNYLAYSWLERNHEIEIAMSMLKKAYAQRENDPYIIDSIGWAYYLIGDYVKAEELLKKAVQIMPTDPIVNDHYADILWKLGKKIQANYFWKNVLTFEDTKDEMKKDIYYKLINGPKKI